MKLSRMAIALALGTAALPGPAANAEDSAVANGRYVFAGMPVWPDNGIAERELGDGDGTFPQNMFVEYTKGKWHAWVIMVNTQGPAKALDFFSGEVLENVKVESPGGYNDWFIDAQGLKHTDNTDIAFHYKDPRPGGGLGGISFDKDTLDSEAKFRCASLSLDVSQRLSEQGDQILWSKVPLYRKADSSPKCPEGVWDSLINTALDLRDGTLLITGGKYIFRVREFDMAPVGSAPHLHVIEASEVRRVLQKASDHDVTDIGIYLTKQLDLPSL